MGCNYSLVGVDYKKNISVLLIEYPFGLHNNIFVICPNLFVRELTTKLT